MGVKFNLIVATCENGGIGYKNSLPWNLKREMAYFQRMTKDVEDRNKKNAVIMGRRTWESIPLKHRPLAERLNIILSSKALDAGDENVIHCYNIEEVVKTLSAPELSQKIETAWIVGGASLYEEVIKKNLCHRLYLTKILKEFPCDTFLKVNLDGNFSEISDSRVPTEMQEEDGVQYQYTVWECKNQPN